MKRVWFYGPEWHFPSWSPITRGCDEYGRFTIVIGLAVTGRVIIPYGEPETCHNDFEEF